MTDHDIDKLYQLQSNEQPPTAVDDNITQLAQQSIKENSVIKPKKSTQKYMPYTLVASVMFIGILVSNFPQNYMNPPNEESQQKIPKSLPNDHDVVASLTDESAPSMSSQELVEMDSFRSQLKKEPITDKKLFTTQLSRKNISREKRTEIKLDKHALLTQIAKNLKLEQYKEAAVLAKQYKDKFGLDQLPQKYHYLVVKKDK